jgi:hypothetical protein
LRQYCSFTHDTGIIQPETIFQGRRTAPLK